MSTAPYSNPTTSREAAKSIAPSLKSLRMLVLKNIEGRTCDGLEVHLANKTGNVFKHQTISARIRELVDLGLVDRPGDTKKTRSGRNALVCYRTVLGTEIASGRLPMPKVRPRTKKAKRKLADIFREKTLELKNLRIATQLACKHAGIIYENPGPPHCAPWRVCSHCGFSENGWNCGYQILQGRVDGLRIVADANAAYQHTVGQLHSNSVFVVRHNEDLTKIDLYERAVKGLPR